MKKIISVLLCLVLALGCAAAAAEEPEKQFFGTIRVNGEFTLKGVMPEGYRMIPMEQSGDAMAVRIVSDDPARPVMILSIAYDESYSEVDRMNDLDDEALDLLEKTFTDADPLVNITYDETQLGTRLMVARTTSELYDYLDILSVYNGYFVEFVMYPGPEADPQHLTDEQVDSCNIFLTELDFVPGIETAASGSEEEESAATWSVTGDSSLTEEDYDLLSRALEKLIGANYEPIAYLGSQDGEENTHCYLCRTTAVSPVAVPVLTLVYVEEDPEGDARILNIAELDLSAFAKPAGAPAEEADGN